MYNWLIISFSDDRHWVFVFPDLDFDPDPWPNS